ncbi:MAG: hypothetical protein QOD39_2280, partial [Mycobacterium sp.]|nr:hypothetical protein [Mycobacterium sp.]
MGASAYVGRVGGLAVALGVGAAVAAGNGVAWATEGTESNSSTSEHSASEGSPNAPSAATSAPPDTAEAAGSESTVVGEGTVVGEDADADDPDPSADQGGTADAAGDDSGVAPSEEADPADDDTAEDTDEGSGHAGGAAHASASRLSTDAPNVADSTADDTDDTFDTDDTADTGSQISTVANESTTYRAQSFTTTVQDVAPVTMAAAQPAQSAEPLLQRVVVNLLSGLGFGALASNLPGAPIWSPFVMAFLGLGSRREFSEPLSTIARTVVSAPVAALALTADLATAAITSFPGTTRNPVAVSANTSWIEFVTGAGNLNNTTQRFGIGGTDLGIMWDNGIKDNPATTGVDEHQVLIAFGDTFSNTTPVRTGVWRFNTLFRTPDDVLSNGLYVPNGVPLNHLVLGPNLAHFSGSPMEKANWADPLLPSPGQPVRPPYAVGPEVTNIPTAGISVPYNNAYGARQYMSFMSVRSWDTPGRWTTNYAGIAYSDDNGQSWRIAPTSVRTAAPGRATVAYASGNENFQQGAFVKPPTGSPDATQKWLYSYGTPSGRAGTVYVSRVQQDQILDTTKYQYWNGSSWTANTPSAAKPILP